MAVSNLECLCFILGWQGGTVHQVAAMLDVSPDAITEAGHNEMQDLMRAAQTKSILRGLPPGAENLVKEFKARVDDLNELVVEAHTKGLIVRYLAKGTAEAPYLVPSVSQRL